MNPTPAKALVALNGLRLLRVGAAADMLWISFGEVRMVPSRRGGTKEVGEWALHLQCPWRFVRDRRVVLASGDFYYLANSGARKNAETDGESVFHRSAKELNQLIDSEPPSVQKVCVGEAGAFEIVFDRDLTLSVMPIRSDRIRGEEWRFFAPATEKPHLVFPNRQK